MTDFFTSCLAAQVEDVKTHLSGHDGHMIVKTFGPFDDIIFQFTDDTPVKCGGQPGDGQVMVIHSRK